jgi:hypothetical protein
MRPDDVRDRLRVEPFEPFRIRLSNGSTYDVRHPDLVWVGRSAVLVGAADPGHAPDLFDRYTTVSLLHVAELEPIQPSSPPGTNGPAS